MHFYYTTIKLLFQLSIFCFFTFRFFAVKTINSTVIAKSDAPIIVQIHQGRLIRKAMSLDIKVKIKTNPKNTNTLINQCTSLIKEELKMPIASNIFPTIPKAIKNDNSAIEPTIIPSAVWFPVISIKFDKKSNSFPILKQPSTAFLIFISLILF